MMQGSSLDIYSTIGNALLNVDPLNFMEKPEVVKMENGNIGCSNFATGNRMQKAFVDLSNYDSVKVRDEGTGIFSDTGVSPIHILLGVSTDATHLNHNGSK